MPTVMKFGGTSVEDERGFERVVNIVKGVYAQEVTLPVVVVSAMSGVTDALLESVDRAATGDPEEARRLLEPHWRRHLTVVRALAVQPSAIEDMLEGARREVAELLQAANVQVMPRPLLQDLIASYGERLSSLLLSDMVRQIGLPD